MSLSIKTRIKLAMFFSIFYDKRIYGNNETVLFTFGVHFYVMSSHPKIETYEKAKAREKKIIEEQSTLSEI